MDFLRTMRRAATLISFCRGSNDYEYLFDRSTVLGVASVGSDTRRGLLSGYQKVEQPQLVEVVTRMLLDAQES